MIILLVTLWFSAGYSMTIDVEQMYGIADMKQCEKLLPDIKNDFEAGNGACSWGDILVYTETKEI